MRRSIRFTYVLAHLIASVFATILILNTADAQQFGRFIGEIHTKWLPDGRNMETLTDFEYIDPDNQSWRVPKGTQTDGASVPRAFFILYAPFTGVYRDSALVHDHYCRIRTRTWQETHDMFYYGLRARGLGEHDSLVMWGAVYLFGPRWDAKGNRSPSLRAQETASDSEQLDEIKSIDAWVKANNPTKDDLERAIFTGAYRQ
jgi:hypothetical protein